MRASTGHASTRRGRTSRRVLGGAVAVVALGTLAVACADDRSAPAADRLQARDGAATAASSVAPPPEAPRPMRDEARGVMGTAANELAQRKEAFAATAPQAATGATQGAPVSTPSPAAIAVSQPGATGAMIIRNGYAGIEVDSLDAAINRVRILAARVGGFVANTSVQGGKDQLRSASLEVKVPAERFDDALAGLAPIGKVESVNVSAEDVGEEYVDIAARVENARRLEARLIALLANRTGKLQEVLSVERELARVREEIERYEGRLRYLRTRASVSTLTITVHERAPIIAPVAGDGPIVNAFRDAWRNFVGLVAAFIASLGVLIPLGALAFGGWLMFRRWAPARPAGGTPPAAGAVSGD